MKTSEQMTADVLKRRDEELKALPKKRRIKMAAIGAPCMAATAALGIVTFNFVHGANEFLNTYESVTLEDYTYMFFHGGRGRYIHTNIAALGSGEMINVDLAVENNSGQPDFTNPNAGQNDIHVLNVNRLNVDPGASLDPNDFQASSVEELYRYYRVEFDKLTKLHSDWTESHDPLGFYIRYTYGTEFSSMETISTRNTLNYTTPNGAKISVTAQSGKFKPLSSEMFAADKPYKITLPEPITEYDEFGNIIGQTMPGYDPDKDPNRPEPPVNDNGISKINGYDAYIYHESSSGSFAADIIMNSRVRITGEGLSETEFLEILDEYTGNVEESDTASTSNTEDVTLKNPNAGKYLYQFTADEDPKSVEALEIPLPQLDQNDFVPQTMEELRSYYGIEFDRLSRLHTDWTESHEPFGLYFRDESGSEISSRAIINTRNTLNYTTPGGAKISVTAKQGRFIPVVTAGEIGAQRPSIGGGYIVDADGNPVEEIVPDYVSENNNTTSSNDNDIIVTVISNYENTEFLAYIDMGITWVKIHAEGLSGSEEFKDLIEEYTK